MIPIQVCDSGRYLYHFTNAETALLCILPSLKLKFFTLIKTNDQMEKNPIGLCEIFSEIEPFIQVDVIKEFKNQIEESFRIICLSTDFQVGKMWNSGYKHPLLWSHYTDRNSGVCLVLDKERLMVETKTLGIHGKRVKYSNHRNLPKFELRETGNIHKSVRAYLRKNENSLFFLKHKHWKFEHEYRILSTGKCEYLDISNSFHKIILGPEFKDEYLAYLKTIIHPEKISKISVSWSGYIESPII